jgi:hypothetical protein
MTKEVKLRGQAEGEGGSCEGVLGFKDILVVDQL